MKLAAWPASPATVSFRPRRSSRAAVLNSSRAGSNGQVGAAAAVVVQTQASAAASHSYSERVDAQTRRMAYGLDGVSNWYKSTTGRVTQNWPFSTVDFWRQMQAVRHEDFLFWP
jgi:hypothetical protein